MNKSKQFYMWGQEAEIVIRVKHENGTTIEVSVSDVTSYMPGHKPTCDYVSDCLPPAGRTHYGEIRIPVRGEWFNKLIETTDYSSYKKGF